MKAFISTIKTPTGAVSFAVCLASFIALILLLTSCQAQTNAQPDQHSATLTQFDSATAANMHPDPRIMDSIARAARYYKELSDRLENYIRTGQTTMKSDQPTAPAWYQGQETERAKEAATTPQATTKTGLSSDGSTYTTRDGQRHEVLTGNRGGRYYIAANGSKRYVK